MKDGDRIKIISDNYSFIRNTTGTVKYNEELKVLGWIPDYIGTWNILPPVKNDEIKVIN